MSPRLHRRRRTLWLCALLLAAAGVASWWLLEPPMVRRTPPDASRSGRPPAPSVLRVTGTRAPPGAAPFVVALPPGGVFRAPIDGGAGARARSPAPPRAADVLIDTCEEPLPEHVEAPEGFEVVEAEGVRVAHRLEPLVVGREPSPSGTEPATRGLARQLAARALAELATIAEQLGVEPREGLLLVLYQSKEAMTDALGTASWADGVYDGAIHLVADGAEGALRHELMHAQLHAVAPCAPYWLDEGLASHAERDAAARAVTWLRMIQAPKWIPFASLAEPLRDDEGADQMEPDEVDLLYAQSLAMVSMLIDDGGLRRAIRASSAGTLRAALWPQVMPDVDGRALLDYLARRLFPTLGARERDQLAGREYLCHRAPGQLPRCTIHGGEDRRTERLRPAEAVPRTGRNR